MYETCSPSRPEFTSELQLPSQHRRLLLHDPFIRPGKESFYIHTPVNKSPHARTCPLTFIVSSPQGGPVEILPFLYLGSAYHASRKDMLDMLGITALINVSSNCPNHFEDHYQYKSIPVEDNHKANISSWFNEAIEFIGECHFFGTDVTTPHSQSSFSKVPSKSTSCNAYIILFKEAPPFQITPGRDLIFSWGNWLRLKALHPLFSRNKS